MKWAAGNLVRGYRRSTGMPLIATEMPTGGNDLIRFENDDPIEMPPGCRALDSVCRLRGDGSNAEDGDSCVGASEIQGEGYGREFRWRPAWPSGGVRLDTESQPVRCQSNALARNRFRRIVVVRADRTGRAKTISLAACRRERESVHRGA